MHSVLNQDTEDKPSDKALTCSRSCLAGRGRRLKKLTKKQQPKDFEFVEKPLSLSARLKSLIISLYGAVPLGPTACFSTLSNLSDC